MDKEQAKEQAKLSYTQITGVATDQNNALKPSSLWLLRQRRGEGAYCLEAK